MSDEEHFHRRHLPHIYLPDAVYFVTFRLAGSLPSHTVERLRDKARLQKDHWISFVDYERALEIASCDVHWLAIPAIAALVAESLEYRDGTDYDLAAYCIMPNHVHVVLGTGEHEWFGPVRRIAKLSDKSFSKIMQSLKRYTARNANDILNRSGAFWHDESYDRILREKSDFRRVVEYVINNPVKAGLVQNWRDWKWTYSIFDSD